MSRENEPVVVATFYDATAAHMARNTLESQGIAAEIIDEHTVSVYPLYTTAVGGIKLIVRSQDALRAAEMLSRQAEESRGTTTSETKNCPRCGSGEVQRNLMRNIVLLLLVVLTLGLIWLLLWKRKKCQNCGYTW